MIEPVEVLPTPGVCPAWCAEPPGHDWENALPVTDPGGRRWYTRTHVTDEERVTQVDGTQFAVNVQADEYISPDGGTLTEPACLALVVPSEYATMDAAAARALAVALVEAANVLDGLR